LKISLPASSTWSLGPGAWRLEIWAAWEIIGDAPRGIARFQFAQNKLGRVVRPK
jgi:hypothetical protein